MPSVYNFEEQKQLAQARQAEAAQRMAAARQNAQTAQAARTAQAPAITTQSTQQKTTTQNGTGYTGYSPSQAVLSAQQYLQQQLADKPGAYVSRYNDQLDALLGRMQNREAFKYDPTNDPLYNIYKDLYIQNGRRAMQDTMGNAAALTGGYGSSYGQSAGQQMYNQYMENLNAIIPQLQQQAYQRYSDEGDRMAQNFQLMNTLENQNYGRYRDTMADWMANRDYAYQAANQAEQMDRQQYQYDTTFRENQRQFDANEAFRQAQLAEQIRQADLDEAYRQAQAAEARRQYDQNFAESVRQADLDEAYRQAQAAEAVRQYNQNFTYQQQQDALAEAYRQAQLAENQRQFDLNFGEEGRQYDASLAEKIREFDIAQALDQAQFDFNVRKYEEALAAAQGGSSGGGSGQRKAAEDHAEQQSTNEEELYYIALPENIKKIANKEPGYTVLSPYATKGLTAAELEATKKALTDAYDNSFLKKSNEVDAKMTTNAKGEKVPMALGNPLGNVRSGMNNALQIKVEEEEEKKKALLELLQGTK